MMSWRRPLVAIAAITLVVLALMALAGTGPDVLLVGALCVLVGMGAWFVAELMNAQLEAAPIPTTPAALPTSHGDRRVMRLRSGLTYAHRDDAAPDQLRAGLVELVDDQLRAAHQIDRAADPDAARRVIGPELWALIDGSTSARQLAQPRTLDRVLTLIEQI